MKGTIGTYVGIPWWSSGKDSVLSLRRACIQSLDQGTKIPQAAQCGQNQTIRYSLFIAHPVAIPSSKGNDILLKNLPIFHTQF